MTPAVSVIIPTHDRATSLRRTLAALERQAGSFEVVVVADACSDGTAAMVRGLALPIALKVVETQARDSGVSRNAGAQVAAGMILLFVDDDIEPRAGFVNAHEAVHRDHSGPLIAVGGLLSPALSGGQDLFVEYLHGLDRAFTARLESAAELDWACAAAGNMSITRALFDELGGFATLLEYGGADYELGLRAQAAGARFACARGAGAYHHVHENVTAAIYLRRARSRARNDVRIAARFPALSFTQPLGRAGRARSWLGALARALALDHGALGDVLAALLFCASLWMGVLRWRGRYERLMHILYEYWYLRGVGDELGGRAAVEAYLAGLRSGARS